FRKPSVEFVGEVGTVEIGRVHHVEGDDGDLRGDRLFGTRASGTGARCRGVVMHLLEGRNRNYLPVLLQRERVLGESGDVLTGALHDNGHLDVVGATGEAPERLRLWRLAEAERCEQGHDRGGELQ